jgi:hypothetical protein
MQTKDLLEVEIGKVFYDATVRGGCIKYEYLCKYPFKGTPMDYHIVLNKRIEEPVRMYGTKLKEILDKGLDTYEKAKAEHVRVQEEFLNTIKEIYNS